MATGTTRISVTIVDALAGSAQALGDVFEQAGFTVEAPLDLGFWLTRSDRHVLAVVVRDRADIETIATASNGSPQCVVLAVLAHPSEASYRDALRAGAAAALPERCTPEEIAWAVDDAFGGSTLLPTEVVRSLIGPRGEHQKGGS